MRKVTDNFEVLVVDDGSKDETGNIFDTISLESRSGVICVEMAKKFELAGLRMVEIPVSHYPRMHGRSEFFRVRHLVHTFRGLLKVWWLLVIWRRLPVWMSIAAKK